MNASSANATAVRKTILRSVGNHLYLFLFLRAYCYLSPSHHWLFLDIRSWWRSALVSGISFRLFSPCRCWLPRTVGRTSDGEIVLQDSTRATIPEPTETQFILRRSLYHISHRSCIDPGFPLPVFQHMHKHARSRVCINPETWEN